MQHQAAALALKTVRNALVGTTACHCLGFWPVWESKCKMIFGKKRKKEKKNSIQKLSCPSAGVRPCSYYAVPSFQLSSAHQPVWHCVHRGTQRRYKPACSARPTPRHPQTRWQRLQTALLVHHKGIHQTSKQPTRNDRQLFPQFP